MQKKELLTHSEPAMVPVFLLTLKAGGDLLLPVVGLAEEKDGRCGSGADFAAYFFEGVFEICADAAREEDGEVEVEFRLPFDEFVECDRSFWLRCRDFVSVR